MPRPGFAFAVLFCTVAAGQQSIHIGQAVMPLTGPWKFHVGDNPRWADANFDDSNWEDVDLTPRGATDYFIGMPEFVPGWTAMGHANYSGYAWYRLKVQMENAGAPVSLLMPVNVDDAYQVFANGQEIGRFGDLTRPRPVAFFSTAEWFRLPARALGQPIEFAVRFYMLPATTIFQPDVGGMHGPPRIGDANVIAALGNVENQQLLMRFASFLLEFIIFFGFAAALLAIYWLDRAGVYLWFASAYFALALEVLIFFAEQAVPGIPNDTDNAAYLLGACWVAFLITGWWQWFDVKEKRWVIRLVWVAVLVRLLATVCTLPPAAGAVSPVTWIPGWHAVTNAGRLAIGVLFAVLVVFGIRRQGREGWLTLPAVLLFSISLFGTELELLHVPMGWTTVGVRMDIGDLAEVALSAVLGILILRRFQRSQKRKQQLEADLVQAQQVQQLLLPQQVPALPGFRIQCEYRPAQEVGGDFFQVIETRHGGLLAVIGDVSGKGVHAAMLVALIIGALRALAEETEEPQMVLQRLNGRLAGRMEGGFATCLCAHIRPDGVLSIANAGHLAPWLEGAEMDIPHDLPLGIAADFEYSARRLQLPENSTLTFVSDGVVEAKNARKELFGFDRAGAVSRRPAQAIAEAAKEFGQEDDITVLTIQRLPALAHA